MKVDMFNVWNESDTKKVSRWLFVGAAIAFILGAGCAIILLMGIFNRFYIISIIFSMNIPIFVTVNPYGVIINSTMVYPIVTGFTMSIIVIATIFVSLFFIILSYATFVRYFKSIRGYESFGEVKRAINAVTHGSKIDKTMVILHMAAIISLAIGFVITWLGPLELISRIQTAIIGFPIIILALVGIFISERYIKRRIVPQKQE